uniref:Uncharacterized protein n=1 Tax=Anguilla anguilla TaxID=7936 RepID=A0A0E9PQ16_ANGAN
MLCVLFWERMCRQNTLYQHNSLGHTRNRPLLRLKKPNKRIRSLKLEAAVNSLT